jgi:iron(III) transport system ATP-binding protein
MDGDAVMASLAVKGLNKVYQTAEGPSGGVRDTSFVLEAGTFFTLLGPSGCGKTTTLRSIAGLETPDAGSIRLGEQVFFDAQRGINVPLNRRNIGMVFQSYAIWPHMTVFENVAFPLRVAKSERYDRAAIKRMVGVALDTVGLGSFGDRSATRLSGGQQQRVALARAIVRQPRLLLLDEPLSNLDAALREDMRVELKRLQQQIGVTTIYVTHDQAEALNMSDQIAVINGGRIVQIGEPREIYFRPCNSFVAGFVGATNLLHGVVDGAVAPEGVAPVVLPGGAVLHCLFPHAASPATRTAISIRPESLTLTLTNAPGQDGWNRMNGVVTSAGFQGNMNRYGIRVGDTVMHANAAAETVFPVGAAVSLDFPFNTAIAIPEP